MKYPIAEHLIMREKLWENEISYWRTTL